MSSTVIPIAAESAARQRHRQQPKGRRVDASTLAEVRTLVGEGPHRRDLLIEHLHRLNDHFGQLGTSHLAALAQLMNLPQAEVFEVASFYHHFDVVHEDAAGAVPAPPLLTVRVCGSLSCSLAGADGLLQKLPALLGADVRVIPAPCIGRCEQAPAVVVHQHPLARATPDSVQAAVRAGLRQARLPAATRLADYVAQGGYALLADCLAGRRSVDEIMRTMESSGLRGLGGAGFPAGRKWRIVMNEPAPRRLVVNIDEGEPGTFKDRVLLETEPHRFLEGLFIAAWAIGAAGVHVYLRDEYHGARALLQAELAALRAHPPVPGLPEVDLRRGAGAYICGEESALIESLEGKRGLPRLRPPYVAQAGLFGRPTLVHNLETLYWVRELLDTGARHFAAQGRRGRQGLRRFSVSGRVREPGLKLAPAGITLNELITEHCGGLLPGHELYAYLPGGASGGILPAGLADLPLDFDTLQPHGCFIGSAAVVVLTKSATHWDRATDAARNLVRFFEDESCGQCTPCRVGTAKMRALIESPRWDAALLADLSQVMRDASICGLGQAAPNPVDCVLRYFADELETA
ncbi:MAG: NAD(P)H-dependent oxidoreductase subunit E [Rubrivivax sp.]|nr:NAD(P)H-dependent oxidoreductase subunit E [Rubrivivax sp.]